ncbi:unnamed protein product [Rotaria socialis]|uniref:Uncharacterized protein n=2 Tax=Rotaria socialis TaxID=392032 RepID=A0A818ZWM1_9BILA|nr:unnamed protein product [Rotaria socialis]CAF3525064.1 unnamed protein product [Rotaria socialis]CAF3776012.1 unnamed protein product [Rotaria socialis]
MVDFRMTKNYQVKMTCAEQHLKNSFILVGILLVFEGLAFLIFPYSTAKLLLLSALETKQAEQFARVAGLAIVVIGYYYCVAGYFTLIGYFRASIIGRLFILPIISAMVYFYSIEVPFLIFGIQDFLSALWSYACLMVYDAEQQKLQC